MNYRYVIITQFRLLLCNASIGYHIKLISTLNCCCCLERNYHYEMQNVITVESRFLEPPGKMQFGSRNREFEKSKVASNYALIIGRVFFDYE